MTGIWWEHWYNNVINTTGFQKYQKKDIKIENKNMILFM